MEVAAKLKKWQGTHRKYFRGMLATAARINKPNIASNNFSDLSGSRFM
jgi:hypothetical protein